MPEKILFRRGLAAMRCVIPSLGFFEWSHSGPKTNSMVQIFGNIVAWAPIKAIQDLDDEATVKQDMTLSK